MWITERGEGMRFQVIRDCRRAEPEQRYIFSTLEVFPRLGEERRREIRALIGRIAATPEEGLALFALLVRGESPQRINSRTGVPVVRLYRMRRDFYEQFPIG